MIGLGDIIFYITKFTGIAWLTHKLHMLTGFECNCMKRRKYLNKFAIKWRT